MSPLLPSSSNPRLKLLRDIVGLRKQRAAEDQQAIQDQQTKLERWAAQRVKPWSKPQRDDYDFRSWTKGASKELLEAGCIYEYARESRRLRCLVALMNPARRRMDLELDTLTRTGIQLK